MKLNIKVNVEFRLPVNISQKDMHEGEKTLEDAINVQIVKKLKDVFSKAKRKKITYSLIGKVVVEVDPTSEHRVN